MNLLHKKLTEKYGNAEDLIKTLGEYNLDDILDKAINIVETKISNVDYSSLKNISGIILSQVNSILAKIHDANKKRQLKYLIADIFEDYLKLLYALPEQKNVINGILENLNTVCEYSGYNFNELQTFLNIEKHELLLPIQPSKKVYYEWLKELEELDSIAKDLLSMKIIYSVKEFKTLFKENRGDTKVRFNKEKKDEAIILFQSLKELEFIKPRGKGSSGHFTVFVESAVDNDNLFLIEKAINKEHERLKKNKSKYLIIKEKIVKLLESNLNRRKDK